MPASPGWPRSCRRGRTGAGGGVVLAVEDCRATVAELKSRGVEITQEPVDQFYGVDAGFRDPSGNQHRITQRTDG
jgi:predicted enzyme related to lactoylglutathione lyase